MNKKTVIQILMITLIVLISLLFYLKYFNKSSKKFKDNKVVERTNTENQNNSSTYINNIDYLSSDAKGNRYQITAEQAEIKIENSEVMLLENVIAYIFIKDSETIKITSDFGKYNSKNYDTIFSKNVIVIYPGHEITGEYLDFSFINNLGTMTTNVVYNGDEISLFADKIEMDLTTKDTKIYMNDNNKKVIMKGTR